MSTREIQGFQDFRNANNVANWRLRFAMTQGRDLLDLRTDAELVIVSGNVTSQSQEIDYSNYERPTCKRVRRKRRTALPLFLRKQANG